MANPFTWFFDAKEVEPKPQPNQNPWLNPILMDWMMSGFSQNANGTWELAGLPGYPGQVSPDLNSTMLPQVWNAWNPQGGAGNNFLSQFLSGGGFQLPGDLQHARQQQLTRGGAGGSPTEAMEQAMQYGGPQGKGMNAIDMMMQYGVPSQAGQFLSNMAQFGIPSEAGRPLHSRAMGMPTAASNNLLLYTGGRR